MVIVQDDRFHATDSVTVCPTTTDDTPAPLLRVAVEPNERTGMRQRSAVMIDKITTTRRSTLHERIGGLSPRDMLTVERSLLVFLGMAD